MGLFDKSLDKSAAKKLNQQQTQRNLAQIKQGRKAELDRAERERGGSRKAETDQHDSER